MKVKITIQTCFAIAFILFITTLDSCKKEEEKIIKEKVTGQVQKGPFINGTLVIMSELNSSLSQTGINFSSQVNSNSGSFEIDNISLTSSFVELSANGYYFDEVRGELSTGPLNLFAVADIKDVSSVNVNIITNLERQRVVYLIKHGNTFSDAKKQAQQEIFAIFGFNPDSRGNSESLDISANTDANAILLAISVIIQGKRSVGDLAELLANISNDLKDDGTLSDSNMITGLRNSTKELDLSSIRKNLEDRYNTSGVTASIPDFERYVKDFLSFTGEKPTTGIQPVTEITTNGAKFTGVVNPDFINTTVSFEYGKTTSYGDSIDASQSPVYGGTSVEVSASVSGLLPGTLYHVRVKAKNKTGVSYSDDKIFTTLGKAPEAEAKSATDIFLSSAVLNGIVNANYLSTNTMFEWGTSTNYGNSVAAAQNPVTGNTPVKVSADLTGLTEETTYHYRIKAENQIGTVFSNDMTFTTSGKSPIPVTMDASDIQMNSATINASVNANGYLTTVSFEWGLTTNYTNTVASVPGSFSSGTYSNVRADITGLTPGTTYHYRVKAGNEFGLKSGDDMTFTTLSPVSDIDGNVYNVRLYGNKVWMTENLKTTRYSNGDSIGTTNDVLDNNLIVPPKYQWAYSGNEEDAKIYGRLYTWFTTVDNRNLCPAGWHVSTDAEWTALTNYLGGESIAGQKLKESGTTHWLSPNTGTNESGFTALPGGYRYYNGVFTNKNGVAFWWTSDDPWYRSVFYNSDNINRYPWSYRGSGFSVRCVKN